MNKKISNSKILIACLLIVIPFNIIIRDSNYFITSIIYYIPAFIGYILFYTQYKLYDYKQKKFLNITTCITIISLFASLWYNYLDYNSQWKTHTMSDMGAYLIPALIFYATYFSQRVLGIILGIKLLKNTKK